MSGPLSGSALLSTLIFLAFVSDAFAAKPTSFQCYDSRVVVDQPSLPPVTLTDGFGRFGATLHPAGSLCSPTSVRSDDPGAPTDPDHLVSYRLGGRARHEAARALPPSYTVTTEFGTHVIRLGLPRRLLVPTATSRTVQPAPPTSPTLGSFTCYAARRSAGAAPFSAVHTVGVEDELGAGVVDVQRPAELCVAAGVSPAAAADPSTSLVCYHVHRARTAPVNGFLFTNQFGSGTLDPHPRELLCVPPAGAVSCAYPFAAEYDAVTVLPPASTAVTSVDWVAQGVVTPVKDQGPVCQSDWAFSAAATIETAYAIATGTLASLSEQELVDCAKLEYEEGCSGGSAVRAISSSAPDGLCSETEYPYTALDGVCRAASCGTHYDAGVSLRGRVPTGDEASLKGYVAEGPVSAVIVSSSALDAYTGGVFDGDCDPCGSGANYTAVTIVGFGTDSGQDYWTLRFSRGSGFGESGYVRLRAGVDKCGITDFAIVPQVQ